MAVGSQVWAPSFSTADSVCFGARSEYRAVMEMVLCPISSCTIRMSTPAITRRLANVCRKQCQLKAVKPLALTAGSNQHRGSTTPPETEPESAVRFCSDSSAAKAVLLRETCRAEPFLLRGIESAPCQGYISRAEPVLFAHSQTGIQASSSSAIRSGQAAMITARKLVSSSRDENRIRALFSRRCLSCRAGFSLDLAVTNGEPVGERRSAR